MDYRGHHHQILRFQPADYHRATTGTTFYFPYAHAHSHTHCRTYPYPNTNADAYTPGYPCSYTNSYTISPLTYAPPLVIT